MSNLVKRLRCAIPLVTSPSAPPGKCVCTRCQAADRIEEQDKRIRELEAKLDLALSKWRSIEAAPKDGRPFITFSPDRDDDWELMYDIAGWDTEGECWWKINCGFNYATHWMPLPEPPDSDVEEALADD